MVHIIISAKIVKKNKKEQNKSINNRVKLSFIVKNISKQLLISDKSC